MTNTAPPPLAFSPPRIYVLKNVFDDPDAARRVERVAAACPDAELLTVTYDDMPAIVAEEGWDHFPKMGTMEVVPTPIPVLALHRWDREAVARDTQRMKDAYKGDGGFPFGVLAGDQAFQFFTSSIREIRPNPTHVCRPQWRLHQGLGCPHQCAYCSLGGYLLVHVNTEEYIRRLAELVRRNPWQQTWLYDDSMDVPTFEPQLDTLPLLMRFFESTGDRYLIIHTKTDRPEGMLAAGAPNNTILAWSLSGPTQSRRLEPRSGTTEGRIEAARVCQEAGMTVRFKFKPIIPVTTWREDATYAVDLALRRTRPDNLSMTVLMWMGVDALKACVPPDLLDAEFLAATESARDLMQGVHVGPFPHAVRENIYRHYLAQIRERNAEVPVTISTESLDMWKSLGPDLGFTVSDYVCGCGAGSIPGLGRLSTNPWCDAREAVDWDGTPVVEEVDGQTCVIGQPG